MEYQISCGNARAMVNSMGGELTSFNRDNIEYIWTGNTEFWASQSPVLFPTVGTLKNRETEINGVKYQMKKHGFARKCEFALIELKKDSAIFLLKANDETRDVYPFDFELVVTHTVHEDGFKTEYKVINTDKKDIIFGIGGHTGFNCPMYPNTSFNDYYIEFDKVEDGPFYYTKAEDCDGVIHKEDRINSLEGKQELKLAYSLFDRDVVVLDKLKSKTIKLLNTINSSGIEFIMNGFNSIGFWTPPLKNAPFICLEPWTVLPDFSDHNGIFEDKPNITKLAPLAQSSVSYEMKII